MTAPKINRTPINAKGPPCNAWAIHHSDPPRCTTRLSPRAGLVLDI